MSFYFYLARCNDDSLYAGYCKDLQAREATHNSGKGAKYTRAKGPVKIVYSETFQTKSEAMKREYAVKKMTREQKETLINPTASTF
jgi:putative endonuclease